MKKINIYSVLSASMFLLVLLMGSCKKDYVNGNTTTVALAGEWWVQADFGDGSGFGSTYYSINTYNTTANNDSLWVDDNDALVGIKGKVLANISNKTFGGTSSPNQYSDGGISVFTITNGVVIANGAHTPGSGDKTDSIAFTLTFDSAKQGGHNVIKFKGYKRTGFAQDDH
ncbi:MAG: lipid-binding protein [Sphingobacteriales bacterium]